MIYRELKVYETPLGLKKTTRVDLCERRIYGHKIFKIDLLPSIFEHMILLLRVQDLNINYAQIRKNVVTVLGGDCTDDEYTSSLSRIYENSSLFEMYFNYHYIMRRDEMDLKDMIVPLVKCVNNACMTVREAVKGTYMAEDSGYLYILDAYKSALKGHTYVEIR